MVDSVTITPFLLPEDGRQLSLGLAKYHIKYVRKFLLFSSRPLTVSSPDAQPFKEWAFIACPCLRGDGLSALL